MGSRESSVGEVPAVLSKEQNLDIQDANGRLGLTVYAHLQGGTQRKTPEARWPASIAKSLPEEITVSTENKAAVEKKP